MLPRLTDRSRTERLVGELGRAQVDLWMPTFSCVAIAAMTDVLPVPGGPWNR